jgi:hypothetical protein
MPPSGPLTIQELTELFSARTRLVELLAEREDPLGAARDVIAELPEEDKAAALAAHPRIGVILTELAYLNQVYEEKFAFRFVVFVDRRSRVELIPVLQERLGRSREEELETGLEQLVRIAEDRWRRG